MAEAQQEGRKVFVSFLVVAEEAPGAPSQLWWGEEVRGQGHGTGRVGVTGVTANIRGD